tara:strand:+ start:12512 stop:14128 length:1617 start_codon:yes stop_codon:yes gene_type:complete
MTVSTTTSKVSYTGNGSTDTFAYGFKIYADGDLKVYVDGTLKTLTTHYTVTNAGVSSGGNVVFTTGNVPASGKKVVIERILARTQSNDWNDYDRFPAETLEDSVDRLTFITQEVDEALGRSVKFATTVTDVGTVEVTGTAAERANKVFGFDSAGDLSATVEIGNYQGDWASATSYVSRDLVKDTSTNNIFICTSSHTSSGAQPLTTNTDSAKWSLIVDAASAATSATNAAASATAAASSATSSASSATTSQNWSTKTDAAVSGSDYSAKEYAQGTQASTGGSSKSWAQDADAVNGAGANDRSAKQWAQGSLTGATLGGSAKDWAQTAEDSQVDGSEYSAKHYSAKSSASATAAASSATSAATAQTAAEAAQAAAEAAADNFDDTYLGAKSSDPSVDNDGDALTAGDMYFNTATDRMRVYSGSAWQDVALDSATVVAKTSATGSGQLPSGTTAQRDGSPSAGYIRFNSTDGSFEGYDGSAWGAIGGGASGGNGEATVFENEIAIGEDYTITANYNGVSAGPISVSGTITVSSGSTWVIV